MNIENGLTGN